MSRMFNNVVLLLISPFFYLNITYQSDCHMHGPRLHSRSRLGTFELDITPLVPWILIDALNGKLATSGFRSMNLAVRE